MMRVMLFVRRASRQGHAVLDRNLETKSYVTVYLCESLFITTRLRSEFLLTTDKASIQASLLVVEGGKALVELGKNINARCVETGYGRLFFRHGKGLSASLKHLTVDGKTLADVGHPNTILTLRESVALEASASTPLSTGEEDLRYSLFECIRLRV
jgi:hypothetical protein